MNWEAVKWSVLMLFIGVISAAVVIGTDASLWFVTLVLVAWLWIFVHYWPSENEEPPK